MAVTANQVYEMALVLMDSVEDNGTIVPDNPAVYVAKTISILNALQFELLPPSQTPVPITKITDNLSVSDRTAHLVLPYGLAAHLLLVEGNSSANLATFFNNRYDELKRKLPVQIGLIEDKYNVLSGMGGDL